MLKLAGKLLCAVLLVGPAVAADFGLNDDRLVSSVEKKVRELQPTRDERHYDLVGWAPGVLAAEARARELNRPVFLFTYGGRSIETGRC
jgi:hypothetical protein